MNEIIKEYAEGILAVAGGVLVFGILGTVFMGKDSPFVQLLVKLVSSSF